jgi:hypothetical protein
MPPTSKAIDYSAYRQRLDDLCHRLEQANIRVDSTRLDSYRKTFAEFEKIINERRIQQWTNTAKIETLLNDLEESQEILEASDQFSNLNKPGLRDRLEKVLSGQRELAKESLAKAEARNVLFELVMAARIDRAGFVVDLDRIEDVFFDLFGRPCFVECKRVHSANKLRTRIEEAARQIGKRCNDSQSSKARGIIALDVSKIENPGTFLLSCQTGNQVLKEIKQDLQAFVTLHKSALQSVHNREKRALGIYVYLRLPTAIPQPIGFRIAKNAMIYFLHHSKSEDGQLTLKFHKRIEDSEDP